MDGSCASKRNELKFIVDTATLTDAVVDGLGETEDVLCGGTGYGDSFVIITEDTEPISTPISMVVEQFRILIRPSLNASS